MSHGSEDAHRGPDVYALYQQGHLRLRAGNPGGAAEAFEQAVAEAPAQASLHEALARAYFAASRIQPARAEFERTLEIDPTNDFAHFGLGRCYERQGRLADAAKHYKLACALADEESYREALGRVRRRLERS
jgi:Tfp pilus assembly protein PilF